MNDEFRSDLKAHVVRDEDGKIRQVFHTDERWLPSVESPRRAAIEYVRGHASLFEIAGRALDRLNELVTYTEPREEGDSYRLAEEKSQFDSTTVAFAQTYHNVPVWRTGMSDFMISTMSRYVTCDGGWLGSSPGYGFIGSQLSMRT